MKFFKKVGYVLVIASAIIPQFVAHAKPTHKPTPAATAALSHRQIEQRLNYLVDVPDFSAAKPLSQTQLMNWVQDQALWGQFPDAYTKGHDQKNYDGFIMRAMAKKFVKDWTGQDLQQWKLTELNSTAHLSGDKLGWFYNTSNTMHERPYVRVTNRKMTGQSRVAVRFNVFWIGPENTSNEPSLKKIGTGAATLQKQAGGWMVSSWKIARKDY